MTILSKPADTAGAEHPPARSGTPTAWATLVIVGLVAAGWLFADPLICGAIRAGAAALAWKRGEKIHIGRIDFDGGGSLRGTDIEWSRGTGDHRSFFRCDMAVLTPSSLREVLLPRPGHDRLWIRQLWLAKTRLLLDTRGEGSKGDVGPASATLCRGFALPPSLLPGSLYAGPVEAVSIGEMGRLAIHDLKLELPSRWSGRVSFRAAEAGLGAGHRAIPGGTARAFWEPGALRIGNLPLGEGLALGELTLRLLPERLDFGLRGTLGKGLIRGDGSLGGKNPLEITLVGQQLGIDAITGLIPGTAKASGTIDQARISFRGDPAKAMEADGSARIVGRNFRWEGRGWESLRLSAAMTGRNLTLTELSLRQGENELLAEGRSSLPEDWQALLRAPFTANFRASLTDAASLASLFGPDVGALGGSLYLDGAVRGADNKAEGYCNFSGLGTKFRRLTVDWVKGCLLFEGATTRIPYVEAASGHDRIALSGWSVENSRPHAYRGEAAISVQDLARRLGEMGVPVSSSIGAGALSGSWKGEGDMSAHRGEFRAKFTEWVSRWTKGGLSGNVEGTYAPGSLRLGKVQMIQDDTTLSLGLTATPARVDLADISVVKGASKKPLATGEISLPLNLMDLWISGEPFRTLAMDQAITVKVYADGLRAEQLADLLGQNKSCSGKIAGWITAGGTAAAPDLNGSLSIGAFSPAEGVPPGDLTLDLRTASGSTTAKLHQQTGAVVLDGECTLPVRLSNNGGIVFPDAASPVRGVLRMSKLPMDGWIAVLAGARPFQSVAADGEATVAGTIGRPLVHGRLELKVAKAALFGAYGLDDLLLPLTFSNATATLQAGKGRYRGQPLALAGSADWSATGGPSRLSLRIIGSNLPFELSPGLPVNAKADLNWSWTPSGGAVLGGKLLLDPVRTDLARRLSTVFCPPGFPVSEGGSRELRQKAPQVDLDISTATNTPVQEGPVILADLHLTGNGDDPKAEGSVTMINQTLRLPSAAFDLPRCTVTFGGGASRLSGTASGVSSAGFCSLLLGGSLANPTASVETDGTQGAADVVFGCTMPARPSVSPLLQSFAWLRQHQLLTVPARFWSTGTETGPQASSLGFYGTPWIWSIHPAATGSGEQPAR